MCGLAGVFGASNRPLIQEMLDIMQHRGPDGQGIYEGEKACLGHNRLTTIHLDGGSQPLSDETGRYHIAYDGEVYNFRQLKERMGSRHRWKTGSGAEVILRLYQDEGPDMVHHLDGMFALVIYDSHQNQVFMARDPLGIKPLYYGYDAAGNLYVASEIKALLKATDDVREFPNGHIYDSVHGLRPYFRLEPPLEPLGDPAEALPHLRASLDAAVQKRLMADVPLGVFLSGGLDSSLIAAMVRRYQSPLKSFAVGTEGCSDLAAAQQVARYLGTDHHTVIITPQDIQQALPTVIYTLESFDPALVRSAVATYFVAQLASQHVKVVLSGEGADELFAGYDYLKDLRPGDLEKELLYITNALHNTNLQRVDRMTLRHSLEARVPFLDLQVVRTALKLAPSLKLRGQEKVEKWILRKLAEEYLPHTIVWRSKEKFALGTGTAHVLREWASSQVTDGDFARHRRLPNGFEIKSKEELFYYRIFKEHFGYDKIVQGMGRSRSLDPKQRYA